MPAKKLLSVLIIMFIVMNAFAEGMPAQAAAAEPGRSARRAAAATVKADAWQVAALSRTTILRRTIWLGSAGDGRWNNPANWSDGKVPGPQTAVTLTGGSDILLDVNAAVAKLTLTAEFAGALRLYRPLVVAGDLQVQGGRLLMQNQPLHTAALIQTGGEIRGGSAVFIIDGAAQALTGLWTTSAALTTAATLDIAEGAVVRLGANSSLILTGDGEVLTGSGLLDVLTNRPNSIEFKGDTRQDLMLAGPSRQFREAGLDRQNYALPAAQPSAAAGLPPANLLSPAAPDSGFGEAASIGLANAENVPYAAVLDSANGYAYFATSTTPGVVVRVDVNPAHTFARLGAIVFTTSESGFRSGVIDSANGLAYFGTSASPGVVVKVDINPAHTFARLDAITLNTGENTLYSAVIDPANGFAYFGTGTVPGIVVKLDVNPAHTFARSSAITLNSGENYLVSAVIDPANGYAYFGTQTAPGMVVKVDVNPANTFTRVAAVTMADINERVLYSAVIDTINGYAYFGSNTSPARVMKVDVNPARTFARIGVITLNTGENTLLTGVIDAGNGYAYFSAGVSPGIVVKVDVNPAHTFARVGALPFNTGENSATSSVIDTVNGFAYFGTNTSPSVVVKVDVNPLNSYARLAGLRLSGDENNLASAVVDTANGYAYFGVGVTSNTLGIVVRIDINPLHNFARTGVITLVSGETNLTSAVIDPDNGYAYFGTYNAPARIMKVDVNPAHAFASVATLTFNTGENYATSAVIDTTNGYAYFGLDSAPGIVVKVDVAPARSFARIGAITASVGESQFQSAVIDPANGYAYFGTYTFAGRLVKVDVNPARTFARIGAITLSTGENQLVSAVIDTTSGFAYFGTNTSPGRVVKVDVNPAHTFARIGAVTLNTGENSLTAATIDPANGYAYFGANTLPGIVINMDIKPERTFARLGAITLFIANGNYYLSSAVIDTANGFAYFGTKTSPGRVVKVALGTPATCGALTSGNWNNTATWDCGSIPADGDNVFISSGKTVTLDVNTANLQHVTLAGVLQENGSPYIISLTGDWTNQGTFTPGTSIGVSFGRTGTQNLTGDTTFYNVSVGASTVLKTSDLMTVNGTVTRAAGAVIEEARFITAEGVQDFDLSGMEMNITTRDDLAQIVVQRTESDSLHKTGTQSTSGVGYGHYWVLTPTGCATHNCVFTLSMALEGTAGNAAKVCEYTGGAGAGWNCARTGSDANMVWLDGLTSFSEWALGNNAGPTALTLRSLRSSGPQGGPFAPAAAALAAVVLGVLALMDPLRRMRR